MRVPFDKEELEKMEEDVSLFIRACAEKDSLGRVFAWASFRSAIKGVIEEENIHNFTFPSPKSSVINTMEI